MKKVLFLFIALLFVTLNSFTQTTRYVPCGSSTPCYATIQAAIDASAPGDIINIAAGTYQESKGGWRDIELFKSLKLIGAGSGQTIIEFSNLQHGLEIRGTNANIWIEGITFTKRTANANSAQWAVIVEDVSSSFNSLTFKDVEIAYASARNLYFGNNTYLSIAMENCNIHNASNPASAVWGCSLRGTVTGMTITNSHFDNNGTGTNNGIGFDIDMPTIINSIQVTGGTFNYNTAKGINLTKTNHATFTGITASNNVGASSGGFGICLWEWAGTSSDLNFNTCTIENNSTDGILFGTEGTCQINNVSIVGGTINTNSRYGIYYYGDLGGSCSNITVDGVTMNCPTKTAINLVGTATTDMTNVQVLNNTVTGGTGNGILLSFQTNCTVNGNIVSYRTANGIAILNAHGATLNDNTSTNNVASGIVLVTSNNISMDGNTIKNNTGNVANPGGLTVRENINTATITNNVFEGNTIGIWVSATNVSGVAATENSFAGNTTYGLQNNSVNQVAATCNWWGTVVPSEIATKISGTATYIPFEVSDGGACAGGLPIQVTRGSTIISGHSTIQAAIDASTTLSGDVINVTAGTYIENLLFNKSNITLRGPNYLNNPVTGSRVTEAILDGTALVAGPGITINSVANTTVNNIIIEGFEIRNYTCVGTTQGAIFNEMLYQNFISNITIRNNKIHDIVGNGISLKRMTGGIVIDANLITNLTGTTTGTGIDFNYANAPQAVANYITNNKVDGASYGGIVSLMYVDNTVITGNQLSNMQQQGIQVSTACSNLTISNNYINNANLSADPTKGGIRLRYAASYTGPITITNNIVSNSINGIVFTADADISGKTININNNDLALNTKSIYHGGTGPLLNATCNWYGTSVPSEVATKISGTVTYIPYSISDGGACIGGPVQVTRGSTIISGHSTIQAAIDAASPGDIIQIAAGTYQESKGGWRDIELFKSLKLIGAGSGQTIVQFSNLQHGLEIRGTNANIWIEGITFTKRTANANSAQWAVIVEDVSSSFNSLTFKDVEIAYASARNLYFGNNTYLSIAMENCNIHNASNPASAVWGCSLRGTVTGMTITNSHFDNNGTGTNNGIGFDIDMPTIINSIQVTGGTFNYNTAKGINLTKTNHATFTGITASNNAGASSGGFGICLWEWVSTSSDLHFNTCTIENNSTDGILFGTESTCQINDVTIQNCFVNNNSRNGIYFYRYLGGTLSNIIITMNDLSANANKDVASDGGFTTIIAATCNWYGTTNGNIIASKISANVTYSPWLIDGTDNEPTSPGFQPVAGSCTGTPVVLSSATPDHITCGETTGAVEFVFTGGTANYSIAWTGGSATGITASPYTVSGLAAGSYNFTLTDANGSTATASSTILVLPIVNSSTTTYYGTMQAAIDAASAGNVIEVCAGTYNESLVIDKSLTLLGPQYNVEPVAGTRTGGEAILARPNSSNYFPLTIIADNVTVKGFEFTEFFYGPQVQLDAISNATRTNINISYNYIHSSRAWAGIVFGESTGTGNHNASGTCSLSNYTFSHNILNVNYNNLTGYSNDRAVSAAIPFDNNPGNFMTYLNINITNNAVSFSGTGFPYSSSTGMFAGGNTTSSASNFKFDNLQFKNNSLTGFRTGINTMNIENSVFDGNTFTTLRGGLYVNLINSEFKNNSFSDIRTGYCLDLAGNAYAPIGDHHVNIHDNLFNYNQHADNVYPAIWLDPECDAGTILINQNSFSDHGVTSNNLGISNESGHPEMLDATNNYWGCPNVYGPVNYFPYYSTVSGTPGSFVFGGSVTNISGSASDLTICNGQSTTLYAGNGSDYVWDNGLGSGANKVVSPAVNTTYTVTGKDLHGCADGSASVAITVNAMSAVYINGEQNGSTTIASGSSPVTLTATAAGAVSYLWNTGSTEDHIHVSPQGSTVYTVIVYTASCSGSANHTVNVVNIDAGQNQVICRGNTASLNATISGTTPVSYLWSPAGSLSNAAIQNPVATPTITTVYTVTINGAYTDNVTVYVNPKPVANAGQDLTISPSGSGTLTGSASAGTSPYRYAWSGPSSYSCLNQVATVSEEGTYLLTVTDAYGCNSSADNAVVAIAASGYTVSGNVSYHNTVNAQMHNVTVRLKQGGVNKYYGKTPATGDGDFSIPGVADGIYEVFFELTTAWGGVTSTDIIDMQNHYKAVGAIPLIGIKRLAGDVINNSSSAIVIANDRDLVNSKRLNPAVSFLTGNWVFTKAENVLTNTYPIPYANSGGYSDITITVSGANVIQNFKSLCYGDVNASYTGVKDLEGDPVDVTEGDGLNLTHFPNPFNTMTTIRFTMPVEGTATVDVYDLLGARVKRMTDPDTYEGVHTINCEAAGMVPGVYIFVLTVKTSDDILLQTGKMVVSR